QKSLASQIEDISAIPEQSRLEPSNLVLPIPPVSSSNETTDPFEGLYAADSGKKRGGSITLTHTVDKKSITDLWPLAQVRDMYIVCESSKERSRLFIIDQHALAERLALEELLSLKADDERSQFRQTLLTPLSVSISHGEMTIFREIQPFLPNFGFRAEEFGPSTILVRAIPTMFARLGAGSKEKSREEQAQDFRAILEELLADPLTKSAKSPLEVTLAKLIACRNSIKAGDRLSMEEMKSLLKRARIAQFPFVCCHGRPSIFEIDNKQLDRAFWR
ncbi:MAG TPA: hypothetical protein VJ044_08600, partial [Candidatus Hodarchaeales archaeon]|nr:hypothetical protein [Candidatus Hodarchaeales archaeon]